MKLVKQTGGGNTTRFFMSKNNKNTEGGDVIKNVASFVRISATLYFSSFLNFQAQN
jgi:hypothetical protein